MASGFLRNTVVLMTGSGMAQLFTLGITLLLARVYSDVDFGVMAIFAATQVILAELSNARYDNAIMLPKESNRAASLLGLCWLIGFGVSIFVFMGVFAAEQLLSGLVAESKVWALLHWLPLSCLLGAILQPLTVYLNRNNQYRTIAVAKVLQAFGTGLTSLYLGYAGWGAMGLLVGFVVGQLLALMFSITALSISNFGQFFQRTEMRLVAIEYKHFPLYSSTSTLLNTFSRQVPVYLLQYFFNSAIVGQFSMANRLLGTPVLLVAQSFGQVFYQRAAREHELEHHSSFLSLVVKTTRNLFALGILPVLLLGIAGPQLFALALGPKWLEAGVFAQYLAPWFLLLFTVNPLTYVLNIKAKLGFELWYNVAIFIARTAVLGWFGYAGEPVWAIVGFALVGVLFNGFMLGYIWYISGADKLGWQKAWEAVWHKS
jgi:lipopolysaccharide exporter